MKRNLTLGLYMTSLTSSLIVKEQPQILSNSLIQIMGGALFIALCSQIKIPLPFSVVPLTLQTLSVLLLGGIFGSRKSACMVLLYFSQIALGGPVLAGGSINSLAFIGPRAGYLVGFLFQSFCFGWIVERIPSYRTSYIFLGGLVTCALQLAMGTLWLSTFIGSEHAFWMGFFPFIPGEILKVLLVTSAVKKIKLLK